MFYFGTGKNVIFYGGRCDFYRECHFHIIFVWQPYMISFRFHKTILVWQLQITSIDTHGTGLECVALFRSLRSSFVAKWTTLIAIQKNNNT